MPIRSKFFQQEIEKRVQVYIEKDHSLSQAWSKIPEKLKFYYYIGNNPAKGGLFRAATINSGYGITVGWIGHAVFRDRDGNDLYVHVRRIPTFLKIFRSC